MAAVTVHGRTREQYYSGNADIGIIKRVKEAVKIPVIGNGDIFTPQDAKNMLEQTGCDGVMVARGARGNPWIFHQIKTYLSTGELLPRPSFSETVQMILRHARMQTERKEPLSGIREMRSHIAWYTNGYPHSAALRERVYHIVSYGEMETFLKAYLSLDSAYGHCYTDIVGKGGEKRE